MLRVLAMQRNGCEILKPFDGFLIEFQLNNFFFESRLKFETLNWNSFQNFKKIYNVRMTIKSNKKLILHPIQN